MKTQRRLSPMTILQILSMFVLSLAAACATEASAPTREDCQRLRDHVADLALAQAAGLGAEERERHRSNLAATGGDEHVATCMKDRSDKYVQCALAADTTEALARCSR